MGIIQVLPEEIANRIAAGEVIERPSSIVKELVENSLDAEATSIEISIRHGGKSLIRITDNGKGMSSEDVELAFERHATSKIQQAEDLYKVLSFGFRGEALPSIAAVSRVKIMTRLRGAKNGTELVIEGGKIKSAKECSCSEGTIVEVRDLFFNTPARRKFMKTDTTENHHVADMVSNLALSRLDVRFVFKSSDRTIFELLKNESVKKRTEAILGPKTSKELLEISGESQGIKISGLIGKPSVSRANRLGQTIFINGRWVKSHTFSYALQEGYRGFLMHGQFPVAVLFLEVDPAKVDVNVHPTKQEVRLSNQTQIRAFMKSLVSERLASESDLTPQVRIPSTEDLGAFSRGPSASSLPTSFKDSELELGSPEGSSWVPDSIPVNAGESLEKAIHVKDNLKVTKILGQIHNTFIIAETPEGMIIIDQHAAHEKIQYEALMKSFKEGRPAAQKLLMDEILELSNKHAQILKKEIDFLGKLGFEIEEFGKNSFVIRSVPSVFDKESPATVVTKFLEEKEEGKLGSALENQEAEVAALMACKSRSVRAHDPLTVEAMISIVEQLSQCDQPFSCPHGRPSILKQTFEDLEKQFKRKL